MKRADVTVIFPDATKEQLDRIMELNGADINKAKGDLESLQGQLTQAQEQITALEAAGQDAKTHKERADLLQAELDGMKKAETIRGIRLKVAGEKKIPASLLTGETEDVCAQQADAILAFAKPNAYPNVPDGGEVHQPGSGSTRDRFAEFMSDKI